MNYGDHNFIEITQQTKLRVEPVEFDFVERVELCCSTMSRLSTQPKCISSTHRTCRVGPSGIWALDVSLAMHLIRQTNRH